MVFGGGGEEGAEGGGQNPWVIASNTSGSIISFFYTVSSYRLAAPALRCAPALPRRIHPEWQRQQLKSPLLAATLADTYAVRLRSESLSMGHARKCRTRMGIADC